MVQFLDTKFGPYQLETAACMLSFHVFLLTSVDYFNKYMGNFQNTLITNVYYFNKYK